MGETIDDMPEPQVDPDPDPGNEAGGVDAVPDNAPFPPVPPDEPLNAQMDEERIPDEVQEPEPTESTAGEDPTDEPPG